jgi:hypothetical protein
MQVHQNTGLKAQSDSGPGSAVITIEIYFGATLDRNVD